jgi:8-oxo-dGTP pyrophosphatase MutT (NUDIX family)
MRSIAAPAAPRTFGTACRHNDEVAVSARMRAMAYRLALSLLRAWWIVRRPCVRCILRRGDAVLLVRHSYGDRPWMFPGGRVRRNENPVATARREMHQELGVAGARWQVFGCLAARRGYRRRSSGRRHSTFYIEAQVVTATLRPRRGELSDARWFRVSALPADRSDTSTSPQTPAGCDDGSARRTPEPGPARD